MAIEQNFYSLRGEMDKYTKVQRKVSYTMEYDEAYVAIFNDDEFKNNLYKEINKAFIKNLL